MVSHVHNGPPAPGAPTAAPPANLSRSSSGSMLQPPGAAAAASLPASCMPSRCGSGLSRQPVSLPTLPGQGAARPPHMYSLSEPSSRLPSRYRLRRVNEPLYLPQKRAHRVQPISLPPRRGTLVPSPHFERAVSKLERVQHQLTSGTRVAQGFDAADLVDAADEPVDSLALRNAVAQKLVRRVMADLADTPLPQPPGSPWRTRAVKHATTRRASIPTSPTRISRGVHCGCRIGDSPNVRLLPLPALRKL